MASSSVNVNNSLDSKSTRICGLCEKNPSKYCCPRCEVYYCSLDCYKSEKHSKCSENFYKNCVNEELAGQFTDEESRKKMMEILVNVSKNDLENADNIEDLLQNLENSDNDDIDSDDEQYVDLESRVKNINLDNADAVWNALTEDERNEFEALLNQGNVDTIIPQWEPWWLYLKKEKLVQDVNDKDESEREHLKNCPKLLQVPKFSDLTNTKPSPAIRFNIANCIASYAFVMRYFNGEMDPLEATSYVLHICDCLGSNTNFEDTEVAVESVAQKCLQSNLIETDKESLEIMKQDVYLIFQGPSKDNSSHYYRAALSELHKIFQDAKKELKTKSSDNKKVNGGFSKKFPDHGTSHLPKLEVDKIKIHTKKIEYYLSFLESCTT